MKRFYYLLAAILLSAFSGKAQTTEGTDFLGNFWTDLRLYNESDKHSFV